MLVVTAKKTGTSQRLEFHKREITIGSGPNNEVVLAHGDISDRHVRIVEKDHRIIVVDLRSTIGTLVNGRRITSPLVVKSDDTVSVGDFHIVVQHVEVPGETFEVDRRSWALRVDPPTVDLDLSRVSPLATEWFVVIDGERRGPFGERDLRTMLDRKAIGPSSLVWHAGLDEWIRADESGLGSSGGTPGPRDGHAASLGLSMTCGECGSRLIVDSGVRTPFLGRCPRCTAEIILHADGRTVTIPSGAAPPAGAPWQGWYWTSGPSSGGPLGFSDLLGEIRRGRVGPDARVRPASWRGWARVDVALSEKARNFGRWRPIEALEAEGWSQRWIATHSTTGARVELLVAEEAEHRVLSFAQALARARHPNVPAVFDATPTIVALELADGETLAARLARDGTIGRLEDLVWLGREIARALRALHAAGLVHRALSPDTIVLRSEPERALQLAGLHSAASGTNPPATAPLGSEWLAPERASPVPSPPTHAWDLYSLGCVLRAAALGSATAAWPAAGSAPALVALVEALQASTPSVRPSAAKTLELLAEVATVRAIASPADALLDAGLTGVVPRSETEDGFARYSATDPSGPVMAFLAHGPLRGRRAAFAKAVRFLVRDPLPLFVPFEKEIALADGSVAWIRRDPVPPRLAWDARLPPAPALAVCAVVFRALALAHHRGHPAVRFSPREVRVDASTPDALRVLLEPPVGPAQETDRAVTNTGVLGIDPSFFSPEALAAGDTGTDPIYFAASLAYTLTVGHPPFGDVGSPSEMMDRRRREDPPSVALAGVPPLIAGVLDRLVARSADARRRSPAAIEAELVDALRDAAEWQGAARRALALSPPVVAPTMPRVEPLVVPDAPTLRPGDLLGSRWVVSELVAVGGEAEVYRVADTDGSHAILKLWFEGRVDPHSAEWSKFRTAMFAAGTKPGFPHVYDIDLYPARTPRPYAVLEEVDGAPWGALAEGSRPLTATELLGLAHQLVERIAAVHALFGVVGDLSASNVLVRTTATGPSPTLLDVAAPGIDRLVAKGYGTPGYVAPEVAAGACPDARADMFVVGILLAEAALRRRLYPKRVEGTLMPVGGFEDEIERVRTDLGAAVPRDAVECIMGMLAADPKRRPRPDAAGHALGLAAARARLRAIAGGRTASSSPAVLERRLPSPIAHAVRQWRVARDERLRVLHAFGLGETVVRYLAAIVLMDTIATGLHVPTTASFLGGGIARPSFGSWLAAARDGARALEGHAFVPEIAELFDKRSAALETMSSIVQERNLVAHGKLAIPDAVAATLVSETDQLVHRLLDATRFLARYPLLACEHCDPQPDGSFELTMLELHGASSDPESHVIEADVAIPSRAAILCTPDVQRRLFLSPFVAWRPCTCGAFHAFLMHAGTGDGVDYFDYGSGHASEQRIAIGRGRTASFAEWSRVKQRPELAGELGADLRSAERLVQGAALPNGTVLGPYEIIHELARGSMGVVYRARHLQLGEERALKVVRTEVLGQDPATLRQLQREAELIARLHAHESIVRVLDFGHATDGTPYLAMELLDEGTLDDLLGGGHRLSSAEILSIGRQLAGALGSVHAAGVVHRDVKPANVLFRSRSMLSVKLADFGIARAQSMHATRTLPFAAVAYAAPEQLAGAQVGPPADVWALGLVLLDLVCAARADTPSLERAGRGQRWARDGRLPDAIARADDDPELVGLLREIARMTAHDPDRRPSIDQIVLAAARPS